MSARSSNRTRRKGPTTEAAEADNIGYGNPPRAHQFRPGETGNPKGRPKGAKNEATILHQLLHRKIAIREGGRTRKITILEAILVRFVEESLKGNTKTAAFLFSRFAAHQSGESVPGADLTEDDREVLEAFARRFADQHKDKKEEP